MSDAHWRDKGECLNVGPEAFFVQTKEAAAPAIAVCMRCEVRKECAKAVLSTRITAGVHAGVWFGDSATGTGGTITRARAELEAVAHG